MKVVVFGLSITSSWGNGHATLWRGLARALRRLGHDVAFFERDVPYYAAHRDMPEPEGCTVHLYATWEDALPEAARALREADVGVVTSYCPDGRAATELVLGSQVAVRGSYDRDTPVTLARIARGEDVGYIGPSRLSAFDIVLSYTGGDALGALATELGARHVVPLYGSVDPDVHAPVAPADAYRGDLSYLGTYADDRRAVVHELFFEVARRMPAARFILGGSMYPADVGWGANVFYLPHVAPAQHAAFYCSSRLTLNATRMPMARSGFCPSGRLFEAAACGVPILSDAWPGLEQFFTPGEEILVATTTDDAACALSLDGGALARVARRARQRCLDEHTADIRARELVVHLERAASRPERRS